jgi:ATP-dependent exoDNAse (exonuclease V) beta subunit
MRLRIADELCDVCHKITPFATNGASGCAVQLPAAPSTETALLKQMRLEFDELLRKDGRVHISEFNKKILNIVASEPVPFLYERLGNKYHHILIDEFQDTSKLQLPTCCR